MLNYISVSDNTWYLKISEELCLNVDGARLNSIYKRLYP